MIQKKELYKDLKFKTHFFVSEYSSTFFYVARAKMHENEFFIHINPHGGWIGVNTDNMNEVINIKTPVFLVEDFLKIFGDVEVQPYHRDPEILQLLELLTPYFKFDPSKKIN